MGSLAKALFYRFKGPADRLFTLLVAPAAHILLAYRKIGSHHLPVSTRKLKAIGVFPIRNHYYEPLFDASTLQKPLSDDRILPGIDLNSEGQLKFLSRLTLSTELEALKLDRPASHPNDFYIHNNNYESGDAEFLYQFVRAVNPAKIVEIGSGNSTKIARLARLKNQAESGAPSIHICIEPYEMAWLENLGEITVVRKRVEECGLDWSKELASGDLLFIDSSHMIRPQGDVLMEYLEILPQLASGVYVHIHDIFTPKDYPGAWLHTEIKFWNEQYLLEAILSNTARYEVVAALNYLKHHHYDALKAVCPYLSPTREPGSFYLRVR